MRGVFGTLGLLAIVATAGCEERHLRAVVGPPGADSGTVTVNVRMEDDPAGAEPMPVAGSRPTVAMRFQLTLERGAAVRTVPDTGSLVAQATLATAGAPLTGGDTVSAGTYTQVRLTMLDATLAQPGQPITDLLGGAAELTITRAVSLTATSGATAVVRIDLQSDAWLAANPAPGPGQPAFTFTGTDDFLAALRITIE